VTAIDLLVTVHRRSIVAAGLRCRCEMSALQSTNLGIISFASWQIHSRQAKD
jgi:hypothetical protein